MRATLILTVFLLASPSPAAANASEAALLGKAVTDMAAIVVDMEDLSGNSAEVGAIRATIGPVSGYSPECRGAAFYVAAMADSFKAMLDAGIALGAAGAYGEAMVAGALFAYWANPASQVHAAIATCEVGPLPVSTVTPEATPRATPEAADAVE